MKSKVLIEVSVLAKGTQSPLNISHYLKMNLWMCAVSYIFGIMLISLREPEDIFPSFHQAGRVPWHECEVFLLWHLSPINNEVWYGPSHAEGIEAQGFSEVKSVHLASEVIPKWREAAYFLTKNKSSCSPCRPHNLMQSPYKGHVAFFITLIGKIGT